MGVPEGKLFEVPRIAVAIDESDPNVIRLAFSGRIELDRGNATQVDFLNSLRPGEAVELAVTCHVSGSRKTHRRDAEGDVDAVVETRSLVVSDVLFERAG
jgi:hypothetical protein